MLPRIEVEITTRADGFNYAYTQYNVLMVSDLQFKGKPIRIQNQNRLFAGKDVMFWHLASLGKNENTGITPRGWEVLPCTNDFVQHVCLELCSDMREEIDIGEKYPRYPCLFRAMRISWIQEVLNLANSNDFSVSVNTQEDGRIALHHSHNGQSYLVVIEEKPKYYRLTTAYPVFLSKKRRSLNRE